jgi:hypothetical protein
MDPLQPYLDCQNDGRIQFQHGTKEEHVLHTLLLYLFKLVTILELE